LALLSLDDQQFEFIVGITNGFTGAQRVEGALQVRQIRRADGYRLDLISGPLQYLVASFQTDGSYELRRSSYAVMVNLTRERRQRRLASTCSKRRRHEKARTGRADQKIRLPNVI
jgi:hypothetical protein